MPAACSINGIDIADQIRNRDIGSRQLFYVAILGSEISDGRAVAVLGDFLMAAAADGGIRVVMDLAAGDVRHLRVKQRCKARRIRLFACPRKPSRMKLWRERIALTICGTTVSSYPTIPGKSGPPSRNLQTRLSRSSSFTRRAKRRCSENGLWRSSPSVRGKLMETTPRGNSFLEAIIRPRELQVR